MHSESIDIKVKGLSEMTHRTLMCHKILYHTTSHTVLIPDTTSHTVVT